MGNNERATRSRQDRSWVTTVPMRSIFGGSVFGGDAISVGCDRSGVRSRWWCDLDGGTDAGVRSVLGGSITLSSFSLSLSLSLSFCVSETQKWFVVKIEM